ncbi:hypothetical protein [Cellulomonas xylanilytica]|nr:hypothetical protein [Cellulomonas xylanilytica]
MDTSTPPGACTLLSATVGAPASTDSGTVPPVGTARVRPRR